jgi:hypothetical protein
VRRASRTSVAKLEGIESDPCQHLEDGERGLRIADHRVVRGMVEWDDAGDGRAPLLVIDGREVTWDEFGRMLMSFEGWQFKLNLDDKSEEL